MLKPYDHQQKEIDFLLLNKWLILCASTGWGKSFVILGVWQQTPEPVNVICPAHLVGQWEKYCKEYNVPHSIVAKKRELVTESGINIISVQWLTSRLKTPVRPKKSFHLSKAEVFAGKPEFEAKIEFYTKEYKKALEKYNDNISFRSTLIGHLGTGTMVIDEFHRVLGVSSVIYKIMQGIKPIRTAYLSATPIEKGAWELYPVIKTCPPLFKIFNQYPGFRNWSEFKEHHTISDPYIHQQINSIKAGTAKILRSLLHVRSHTGNEDCLIREIPIKMHYPDELHSLLYMAKRNLEGTLAFGVQRQLINLFVYNTAGKTRKTTDFNVDFPVKVNELKKLISKLTKQSILFYEFENEKEILRSIPDVYMATNTSAKRMSDIELFQGSDKKVMAFHYKQMGEGVRISFVSDIIFFTVSVSNKSARQAAGRAMFAGRTEEIRLHRFFFDHPFDQQIREMLEIKRINVQKFMSLKVEEL